MHNATGTNDIIIFSSLTVNSESDIPYDTFQVIFRDETFQAINCTDTDNQTTMDNKTKPKLNRLSMKNYSCKWFWLWTIMVNNTAQNSSDNPPDNHPNSDTV